MGSGRTTLEVPPWKIFNLLKIFQLRGGFGDNNLSGGFGIPFLGLNYAYSVEDLTQRYNHSLEFVMAF